MPMTKETGKLLSVMRSTNIKANARVAELNTATKLALLHFKGVDCSDVATITDMRIGPKELTAMVKKATKAVVPALRKMYLSVGNKDLQKAVEDFITGLEDSSEIAKRLEKTKDQNAMLRIVCSAQAAIAELAKVSGRAVKDLSKTSAPMSAEAKTLLQNVTMEHDFDMLDDLLAEVRAQTDIPNAPKGKPTRGGRRRKNRQNIRTARRWSKGQNPTKRCSRQKSWHQKNTRRHRKRPVCL